MIKEIDKKLQKIKKQKRNQRKQREKHNFPTTALVGYTNSGKSTLMRALTGKKVYVADELFATLDTRIGEFYLPNIKKKALLSDTIGFISDLPPILVASFMATLDEAKEADLLLHVIDLSDSLTEIERKMKTVNSILKDLKAQNKKQILVANKVDLLNKDELEEKKEFLKNLNPIFISASKKRGFDKLIREIEKEFSN